MLIKPPFGIRTKSAYDLLDASEDLLHFDPTKLEQAIERRNYHEAKKNLGNTFTKPIVEQCPSLSIIMETLDELGIGAVSLSGSGPTLFALTEDSGIIEELEAKLEKKILTGSGPKTGCHIEQREDLNLETLGHLSLEAGIQNPGFILRD